MAILHGNAEAAISMAVHVAGLLQRAEDRALRERDLDRQRPHPGDAARPGRGAPGAATPGEEDVELVGQHERPRAARRSAQKDDAARVLHWLENEGVITLKRGRIIVRSPDGAQGAPRLSRCRVSRVGLRSR